MGLYIKNMEMPKYGCDHCFLRTGNYCGRIEKNEPVVEYARKSERHPDCPLVPVPPHGDLISRETAKLYHSYLVDERTDIRVPAIPLSVLNVIPTIIPAEEGE